VNETIRSTKDEEKENVKSTIRVGILGDFDPNKNSHSATNDAIRHAAKHLSIEAQISWISTPSLLTDPGQKSLAQYDGLWASPGSPYQSMPGMIKGIQTARLLDRPFVGT
jgi:CTP synthase (UTP-ammonia lyase)